MRYVGHRRNSGSFSLSCRWAWNSSSETPRWHIWMAWTYEKWKYTSSTSIVAIIQTSTCKMDLLCTRNTVKLFGCSWGVPTWCGLLHPLTSSKCEQTCANWVETSTSNIWRNWPASPPYGTTDKQAQHFATTLCFKFDDWTKTFVFPSLVTTSTGPQQQPTSAWLWEVG